MLEPFSKDKIKKLIKFSSSKDGFHYKIFIKYTLVEIFNRTPKHWFANNETTSFLFNTFTDSKIIKATPKHILSNQQTSAFLNKRAIRYFLQKTKNRHVMDCLDYMDKNISEEEIFELFTNELRLINSKHQKKIQKNKNRKLKIRRKRSGITRPKADAFFRSSQGGSFSPR